MTMLKFESCDTELSSKEDPTSEPANERLGQVVGWVDSEWLAAPVPREVLGEWVDARGRPVDGCRGVFACARLAGSVTKSGVVRPGLRVSGFESRADAEAWWRETVVRDQLFETAIERAPHMYNDEEGDGSSEWDAGGALTDLLLLHHRDFARGEELVFARADADIACAQPWRPTAEDAQAIARLLLRKHAKVEVRAHAVLGHANSNAFDLRMGNITWTNAMLV